MRKLKYVFLIFTAFLFSFVFTYADNVSDVDSILADLANPVFDLKLTDGDVIIQNDIKRKEVNDNISVGSSEKVSLYDRFGPNISYVPYYGEIKINTNIADKFYTYFIKSNQDVSFINTLREFFSSNTFEVNNIVYEKRVDISNSSQDPRYVAWQNAQAAGRDGALANFYLNISKNINDFYSFLIGDYKIDSFVALMEDIFNSENIEIFKSIILSLIPIFLMFFIFNMSKFTIRYLKGSMGFLEIFKKGLLSLVSITLIITFVSSPLILVPVLEKFVEVKNNFIEAPFDVLIENEVVENSEDIVSATLFYINIFDPWCVGTFGRPYEKMYTTHSETVDSKSSEEIWPVSNDDIISPWDDGTLKYSCAQVVGDVKIPIGGAKDVRNWAALGYSVQSIYHIDATRGSQGATSWPNAESCVKNSNIYVDNLRLIDAMLNISEEYSSPGETTGNIPTKGENAPRAYSTSKMVPSAIISLFRSLFLTFPIFYFSMKGFIYLIELLFYFAVIVWNSIKYLVSSDEGPIGSSLKTISDKMTAWILVSFMQYITIVLYSKMYMDLYSSIIYLIMSFILVVESPSLSRRERELKYFVNSKIRKNFNKVSNYTKRKIEALK